MPESVKPVPSYTWWGEVPDHLRTATQLAALDLPRQAAGPVRATIETRNPGTGRKEDFDLYDVRESVPTAATAAQLLAAGARRTTTSRTCEDCGAHPETPCTPAADGRALCGTCAHITRLRTRQAEARAAAQDVADTADRLLADEHLAVLQIDYIPGEPTAAGTPRPPAAARLTVLDRTGTALYDRTVRLTGPRTPGAPDHAIDPAPALADLTNLLAERTVVLWTLGDLDPLYDALRRLKLDTALLPEGRVNSLRPAATQWRADLDPRTGELRRPTPPGTADRLLLLLRKMSADALRLDPTDEHDAPDRERWNYQLTARRVDPAHPGYSVIVTHAYATSVEDAVRLTRKKHDGHLYGDGLYRIVRVEEERP
ncbi:hypothetical protein GCM10009760_58430 [Kitasatospora kazusensis]|uniref:Uncharacterized protein n=1 Tax=Kitasatospora kazusensis TaxID=407974 RepID=A0ABN3AA31_9ACTN